MVPRFLAIALFAILTVASEAGAQKRSVTLSPARPARWDVAAQVGWFGGNKSEIAPGWNEWYDAASIEVAAGRYWTPHLKAEVQVSTTADATLSLEERVLLPPDGFPLIRPRDHRFRATTAGAGLFYQFFENAWFHPFIGAGLAVVHERQRAGAAQPLVFFRDSQTRVVPPASEPFERTSTGVRPFAILGFKAYVSERGFIRTDLRGTASKEHVESVAWSGGVGFDF